MSGELREIWDAVDTTRGGAFGSSASGVLEAYTYSSGTLDSMWNKAYDADALYDALISNPIG